MTRIQLRQSAHLRVVDYNKVSKKVTITVTRDGNTEVYKLGENDSLDLNFDFDWSTGKDAIR